jgi:uncharacterized surface protein with fasciclin (FAS1) repeats
MNFQAAIAGAVAMNAIYVFQGGFTATAAWGWRSTGTSDFTCSQGNIGCESTMMPDGPCTAANYTCTVTPTANKGCNVATTTLKCSKNATATTFFQPDQGACIDKGMATPNMTIMKDSQLRFDPAPVCVDVTGLKDIVATAQATGSHGVLAEALTKANLVTALQGTGPFTVFAPTDAAFTAALAALGNITKEQLLNRADLADILKYHVISGSKIMAADLQASQTPTTLEGQTVTITKDNTGVKFATAKVTTADQGCTNGVIHVIDGVVLPPATGTSTTGTTGTTGSTSLTSNVFRTKALVSVACVVMATFAGI